MGANGQSGFNSIIGWSGQFYSDCLSLCGNAYSPSVYEYFTFSRADRFLEVMLSVVQVERSVLDAADVWQEAMEKAEGEDWVAETKFNCTDKYNAIAQQAFRNVTIEAITIGYNLQVPTCED
jgi:hypothetical protein